MLVYKITIPQNELSAEKLERFEERLREFFGKSKFEVTRGDTFSVEIPREFVIYQVDDAGNRTPVGGGPFLELREIYLKELRS